MYIYTSHPQGKEPYTMPRWGDEADSDNEGDVGLSPVAEAGDGTAAADGTAASASGSSSAPKIPPTHTSKVDSRGIKIVTSYRAHPSRMDQLLKTVTRVKVTTHVVREARAVSDRRRWKKFGQAALDEDTSNVTIQSRDDVHLEDPNADSDLQDEDAGKALAGNLNAFWAKQQRRQLERKYDVDGDIDGPAGEADGGGWQKVGEKAAAGGAAGGSKYVPPSQRGLAAGAAGGAGGGAKSLAAMAEKVGDGGGGGPGGSRFGQDRDQNTIRVTNISEDTTEADLQELFQPFGRISRVYLAKDKETMISRGFAFISFVHREDATRAMEKLQGYGYDHLILKVSYIFIHTYIYIYVIHIYIYICLQDVHFRLLLFFGWRGNMQCAAFGTLVTQTLRQCVLLSPLFSRSAPTHAQLPPPSPNPRCLLSPPFPPFAARVGPAVGPQGPGLRVRRLPLRIRQGPGPGHQGEGFVRVQPHHRYGRPLGASQAASSPSSRFIHRCNVDESLTSHTDQGGYRAKYRRKSSSDLSRSSASWPWVKNPSGYYYPCYAIC